MPWLFVTLLLNVTSAYAQDCTATVADLRDAIAHGDAERVRVDWAKRCPGLDGNDLEALKGYVCPHGGFVDHIHNQLSCF
jgi:hypothetical protein